ncbi:hypothetical protein Tco_1032660 [Tanacetum coccineum]|uniref:Uncharacterized protein n=1 Tax=Tanacetum coccineum TaxID=301880 RepID=A0ABQ5GCN9_9ASTR
MPFVIFKLSMLLRGSLVQPVPRCPVSAPSLSEVFSEDELVLLRRLRRLFSESELGGLSLGEEPSVPAMQDAGSLGCPQGCPIAVKDRSNYGAFGSIPEAA